MSDAVSPDVIGSLVGKPLGTSDWFTIDQERVDAFADVTEDHQFVHVDPERAAKTPFGSTIAHGLLTLSLIVHLCLEFIPRLERTQMVLNYGFDRVRFPAPVRVGRRVRAKTSLAGVARRKQDEYLLTVHVEIEIEGEPKPALVADWLSFHVLGDTIP
jgi:acyl dehydratase